MTSEVEKRVRASASSVANAGFYHLRFQAMSTECSVKFRTLSPIAASDFINDVLRWVAWFEATYSRFLPESLVSRINAAAGERWVEIDPETENILNLCQELIFVTQGAFDPTALPLISLWNWKADPPRIPTSGQVAQARELVGWRQIQRRPGAIYLPRAGMCLDLGGVGKEYAVDRVTLFAHEAGLENVLVDFGQDIRATGTPPEKPAWHIGLQDPGNPARCWTGLAITNQAVATSGDYLRHFHAGGKRYGHIIDPRTGYPVDNRCRAVTVIAPSCTFAGVLSTTAFILGPREGLAFISNHPGVEGCVLTEQQSYQTRKFQAYVVS